MTDTTNVFHFSCWDPSYTHTHTVAGGCGVDLKRFLVTEEWSHHVVSPFMHDKNHSSGFLTHTLSHSDESDIRSARLCQSPQVQQFRLLLVVIDSFTSSCGEPQGSTWGTLLFLSHTLHIHHLSLTLHSDWSQAVDLFSRTTTLNVIINR